MDRATLQGICASILANELGVLEGAKSLAAYGHLGPDLGADSEFLVFSGVASQTDHLPTGPERARWSPSALQKIDLEIAECNREFGDSVRAACHGLLERLGDS
ncbi:MAG: hypothetical protein V3T86_14515 [Planctomycetota bacterium]